MNPNAPKRKVVSPMSSLEPVHMAPISEAMARPSSASGGIGGGTAS